MNTLKMALVGTLMVLSCACARKQERDRITFSVEDKKAMMTSVQRDVWEQNRLNSFFYVAIVPRLQSCWSRLQGKGQLGFKYIYRRDGTKWLWESQQVEKSNLPQGQDTVALPCMQDAAHDTSFPTEGAELKYEAKEMQIHWGWPVPFPQNITQLGLMANNGNRYLPGYGCEDCGIGGGDQFHRKIGLVAM